MKRFLFRCAFTLMMMAGASHSLYAQNVVQPQLGFRSSSILNIDGFQFKDLNQNGKLDVYEDWRLPDEQRAKDLLKKMSVEQKAGLMLISTTRLANDWSFEKPKTKAPINSGFNEEDLWSITNMFTRDTLPVANLSASATTKGVTERHLRNFILRANTSAKILAEWQNNLQALCENDGLGIPALVTSNPRNHIAKDASLGADVGLLNLNGTFSLWPGELGLSAMRDLKMVREFSDIARQEWLAVGLRKGYMYMADLSVEPRWQRIEGTFGENADWVADMIKQIVLGFQGNQLSNNSIALTIKHFPGGGAAQNGQDSHYPWGKNEVYPGNMFDYALKPFKVAIDAGVSAIMPYYSRPIGTKYPEQAYAYNKMIINDLLRKQLGFKGIINSDTGPIDMMPWGVENLSITERYAKSQDAGVNLYSGTADPSQLLDAIKAKKVNMKTIDTSIYLILMERFKLGLFENPYVDVANAEKIVGNPEFQKKADTAHRKSIVLLRNENNILPLKQKTKVYFETFFKTSDNPSGIKVFIPAKNTWDIEFVNDPNKADVILSWLIPGGSKPFFNSDSSAIYLSLSKNNINTCYLNCLYQQKPTILIVNYSNPWVIDEIYSNNHAHIKGVLATFGTKPEAVLDILTGKYNPSAKMPFSTPISEEKAQNQKTDVPGFMEGKGYALFNYNEGLNY